MSELGDSTRRKKAEEKNIDREKENSEKSAKSTEIEESEKSVDELNKMEQYLEKLRIEGEISERKEKNTIESPIASVNNFQTAEPTQESTREQQRIEEMPLKDENKYQRPLEDHSTKTNLDISRPIHEKGSEMRTNERENLRILPRSILDEIDKYNSQKTDNLQSNQFSQEHQQQQKRQYEQAIRIIPIGTPPQNPQSQQGARYNQTQQNPQQQERPIRIVPIGPQPQAQQGNQFSQQPQQQQQIQTNQRFTQNVIINEEENQWDRTKKEFKEKWQKAKVEIKKKYKEIEQKIKTELGEAPPSEQIKTRAIGQKPVMKIKIPDDFSGYSCHFCHHALNPELVERVFKGMPTICEYCGIDLEPGELLK